MRIAGVGVALALVASSPGTTSGQGLSGGPITSKYGKKVLGKVLEAERMLRKLPKTTTLPFPVIPGTGVGGKVAGKVGKRLVRGGARGARGVLLGEEPGKSVDRAAPAPGPKPKPTAFTQQLNSADTPEKLQSVLEEMAKQAKDLKAGDIRTLIQKANSSPHRRAGAPEMRDVFRQLERNHPNKAIRDIAGRAADTLDPTAHVVELRRVAEAMKKAGKPGVEIWAEVAKRSVGHHITRPDLTDAQEMDEVIADLAAVFNGPDAQRHLEKYERTLGLIPYSDPHVDTMIRALRKRDLNAAFAPAVDTAKGTDFKPEFRDDTNNQVYHTNFFVLLGYAAGKHDPFAVNNVNLYHETVDAVLQGGGGSVADYRASQKGASVGTALRKFRDGDNPKVTPDRATRAIPTIIGSRFSDHPADFARPWGPKGPDFTPLTR